MPDATARGILSPGGNSLRRMCLDLAVALGVAFLPMPSALTAEKAELGDVHFPISCKAEVQSRFDYGLALLHSFEFREAEEAFRAVESDDPKCVIAVASIVSTLSLVPGCLAMHITQPYIRLIAGGYAAALRINDCTKPEETSTAVAVRAPVYERDERNTMLAIKHTLYRGNLVYTGIAGGFKVHNYLATQGELGEETGNWQKNDAFRSWRDLFDPPPDFNVACRGRRSTRCQRLRL
jgi:hypothetical protein